MRGKEQGFIDLFSLPFPDRMTSLDASLRNLYPFRSHCLNLDGLFYHFLDEGEGECLLLVHGNPTWSFHYRELIKNLRHEFRLIAPDHIGCGLSDKPGAYRYTLAQHISNLEKLVLRKDLRDITVVMHDWGGPIGLGMAARHPERIKRLVLLNTIGFPLPTIPWFLHLCRVPVLGDLLVRRMNLFLRGALRLGFRNRFSPEKDVRRGYLFPYLRANERTAIHRFIQDIPHDESHPSWSSLEEVTNGLTSLRSLPTLLLWGGRDPVFREDAYRQWGEVFPEAERHLLPDAGHYLLEDSFDEVLGHIVTFLKRSRNGVSTQPHASSSCR